MCVSLARPHCCCRPCSMRVDRPTLRRMPVIEVTHPLVKHKVGLLREATISTKEFRDLTNELGRLLAYEATADFPLEKTTIECWSGPVEIDQVKGRKVT